MKKLLLIIVSLCLATLLVAQSSKGFSFQGYARGADGAAMQNETNLPVRFTVFSSDEASPEFVEEQSLTTDEFGVFQTVIGTVNSADFNSLNFASTDYSLKVELKDGGVWQEVTTTSLLAVPYAKAAERATEAESVKSGSNGVPVGSIMPFAGPYTKVPEGWLLCNGQEISRTDYAALYDVIGLAWGDGNNSTTFNVPDMRGAFMRGVDLGRGWDDDADGRTAVNGGNTGDNVGSYEKDEVIQHKHNVSTNSGGSHSHTHNDYYWKDTGDTGDYGTPDGDGVGSRQNTTRSSYSAGSHSHSVNESYVGGDETRPENMAVNFIIKY